MVEIDGEAGGGQILRTSLTLSALTGEPVTVTGIRGNRPEPGLKAQHLTAVETAAAVCDATVDGATLGATSIEFDPGEVSGGSFEAEIGTAGSVTLLFDTFLALATRIDRPLTLTATGGTDVAWSPPMAYYRRVKLPLLRRRGLAAVVESERTGFYPAGGGQATLRLWPSSVSPLSLTSSEPPDSAEIYSTAAADLADADVAARQADAAEDRLADLGVETIHREVTDTETASPGSSVVVRLDGDGFTAGFTAYGEQGSPAESVGREAVEAVREFRDRSAAVDHHLADQVLVWLAVAGGRVAIPRATDHVETSLPVFRAFGYDLSLDASRDPPVVVGREEPSRKGDGTAQ